VHTAAIKNIIISEDNPWETIRTNVKGTYNVAMAASAHEVEKAIFISSDKAVESTLLYGDSKAIGEKLWRWANRHSKDTKFSIIRPGNFWKSKGNVFERWDKQKNEGAGSITVTSLDMERYFIQTERVAEFISEIEDMMVGGETFIPKMELYRIYDLALGEVDAAKIKITEPRPGEKLFERLYTQEESTRIEEHKDCVVIT
jgi:UDP-N-acetylglucosamine 4,6-dehydratase